jgi:carboxymethylenebutenolidase
MAAAHLLLESTGLAGTLVSERESDQMKVIPEAVAYPGDPGVTVQGYLCRPSTEGKHPAVIVIHENRGLNDHIRDVTRRFAAEGFVAMAPDLLSRKGGTGSFDSPDAAREAIMAIPAEQANADLKAGVVYLDNHPSVMSGHCGSVGFCWGGARSFLLSTERGLLRAAVIFYGNAPAPEKLQQVDCPLLGLYGQTDERITSQVPEVAATLTRYGKSFEYKIYPGAGHAFFNDTGTNYNAAAAKDAWPRVVGFLKDMLR